MTTSDRSAIAPDDLAILQQLVQTLRGEKAARPSASLVVAALLRAEKAAKQQRLIYPFAALNGEWRLCFTTGVRKVQRGGIRLGQGFYMPGLTPAYIAIEPAPAQSDSGSSEESNDRPIDGAVNSAKGRGEIRNQIQLGGLRLRLTGPCRYLGKKNLLAFDFTQMQISLFDRPFYRKTIRSGKTKSASFDQQPIAQLPFFAFFWITNDFIAARGRGGGLAVWVRASEQP
jgi:hypothetical protein